MRTSPTRVNVRRGGYDRGRMDEVVLLGAASGAHAPLLELHNANLPPKRTWDLARATHVDLT